MKTRTFCFMCLSGLCSDDYTEIITMDDQPNVSASVHKTALGGLSMLETF